MHVTPLSVAATRPRALRHVRQKNAPAWRVRTWSSAHPLHLSRMRKQWGSLYPSSARIRCATAGLTNAVTCIADLQTNGRGSNRLCTRSKSFLLLQTILPVTWTRRTLLPNIGCQVFPLSTPEDFWILAPDHCQRKLLAITAWRRGKKPNDFYARVRTACDHPRSANAGWAGVA
jgi:hypothetical protein